MALGEIKALAFSDGVAVTAATAAPAGLSYYKTDAVGWGAATTTVTYDLTVADDFGNTISNAFHMLWALKNGTTGEKMAEPVIDHPSATSVRFTFGGGFPPGAATYVLVGR